VRKGSKVQQHAEEIAAIVGSDHVSEDPAALGRYAEGDARPAFAPFAVARPGSSDEVGRLVTWANVTTTPLVPVSSRRPHAHGGTTPSVAGALMVDLTRMDRVLRVDRRDRMVVVEPGVTWPVLQAALAPHGMRVTAPLLPREGKSVVASLLEREPTLIPRYDFSLPEPLRDCGVVWGSGVSMFTGEAGSGPASLEDQWLSGVVQAEPKGPAQTDFYRLLTGAQGTMGIVTWASVKCELVPAVHELCFATAERFEDLAPLVRGLCLQRLGDEIMVFDRAYLERLLGSAELPAWTLVVCFGGRGRLPEERVRVCRADAAALALGCGSRLSDALPGVAAGAAGAALLGAALEHSRLAAGRSSAEVFFLSTLGEVPGHLALMREAVAGHGFSPDDVGVYVQPQHQGLSYHVGFSLAFDGDDAGARERAARLVGEAGAALIAAGAYFSRPYGAWAGPVYDRDPVSRDVLRRVKRIFDPNGIMNPGKLCFPATAGSERPQVAALRDVHGAASSHEREEA
jgi:FAD/FMN-containing dehydrogenase